MKAARVKKSSSARDAANPMGRKPLGGSSSKKKKSSSSAHASSLEADLQRLADPGKLRPVRAGSAKKKKSGQASARSEEQQLEQELAASARLAAKRQGQGAMEDGDAVAASSGDEEEAGGRDEAHIDARLSRKILEQVHAQQREEEEGEGEEEERQAGVKNSSQRMRQLSSLQSLTGVDEDEMSSADEADDAALDEDDHDADVEDVELSAEDAASLEMFLPSGGGSGKAARTLGDIILDKIREKEQQQAPGGMTHGSNVHFGAGFDGAPVGTDAAAAQAVRAKLDPKIVEVYTKVGKFLSHYSSGKIPKAFKLIPNLKSWEEVLFLTNPDDWSVQSYYVATKLFSSNFNPKQAQRFYAVILLPKIRHDIETNKHLHFHLYQSIKKSLYKPAAFFKGLLLPLAEEGASARESVIMASILAKCTIPVLHSSVALLKLAQMPYSGTTALFIKTLLNKKYSLPRQVIRQLVQYFCAFRNQAGAGEQMPLLWHQTLLTFVQRYKLDLTPNQVTAIKSLLRVQSHHALSAEIRRELAAVAMQHAEQGGTLFEGGATAAAPRPVQGLAAPMSLAMGGGGFTSLAASLKNPQPFGVPAQADASAMEL